MGGGERGHAGERHFLPHTLRPYHRTPDLPAAHKVSGGVGGGVKVGVGEWRGRGRLGWRWKGRFGCRGRGMLGWRGRLWWRWMWRGRLV